MRIRLADPTVTIVDLEFRTGVAADFAAAVDRLPFRLEVSAGDYRNGELAANLDFRCLPLQVDPWNPAEKQREEEADTFASYLLMPIDDYRNQVDGRDMTRDLLSHITDRYGVSLLAAARKWIEFTSSRAAMVVARDGFALWGRASARHTGPVSLFRPAWRFLMERWQPRPPPLETKNPMILSFFPPACEPSASQEARTALMWLSDGLFPRSSSGMNNADKSLLWRRFFVVSGAGLEPATLRLGS